MRSEVGEDQLGALSRARVLFSTRLAGGFKQERISFTFSRDHIRRKGGKGWLEGKGKAFATGRVCDSGSLGQREALASVQRSARARRCV